MVATLFSIVAAFVGFYLAEVAKLAVRARHVAEQGYVNAVGALAALKHIAFPKELEERYEKIISDWMKARQVALDKDPSNTRYDLIYKEVDKEFLGVLADEYNATKEWRTAYWMAIKDKPGRADAMVAQFQNVLSGADKISEQLPDRDAVLLGAKLFFHFGQFKSGVKTSILCLYTLSTYIKAAREQNAEVLDMEFLDDNLEKMLKSAMLMQVALQTLIPLLAESRKLSIYAHSQILLSM